jgi:type IV pilus assembly protein PilB
MGRVGAAAKKIHVLSSMKFVITEWAYPGFGNPREPRGTSFTGAFPMQQPKPARTPEAKKRGPFSLRVGELLIKEGLIQSADLTKALEIQKGVVEEAQLPIGTLMVQKKLINEEQLETLLKHPDLRKNLGTLVLEKKIVNAPELDTALRLKQPRELLGQVLVRRKAITRDQLEAILEQQAGGVRLGELAYNLELITESDLDQVVRIKSGHRTIGEILCDTNALKVEDLNHVLVKYGKQLKLGDILIKQGLIDEKQYQMALQEQNQTRKKLGLILVDRKFITTDQLYLALSRQFNIPFSNLGGFEFDSRQRRILTGVMGEKYARKHNMLPLSLRGDRLQVGISDPKNRSAIESLKPVYPDLRLLPALITQQRWDELFGALYGSSDVDRAHRVVDGIQDMELIELASEDKIEEEAALANNMLADQVVNFIIRYGITQGASDIHIEQDRLGARLRYRTDGICKEVEIEWLNDKLQEMPNAIISRIKVLSNLDIAERRLPQDGVFRVNYYDPEQDRRYDLDFRVATCPAIIGENVTIRILDSRKAKIGLESLNHALHVIGPLKRLFKSSAGMVLVSGPTGSGKSSTLYAALRYIYHPGIKIITAEDPIEYSFPGTMQTQVKPKIGLTFSRLLRSFLRLDPDVILVGEIRDEETASIAFDAAQTGHLMLSTLHTNDAISAVSRLLDLNIEYNQIASSLIGVLAQRLVRKICEKCKHVYEPPEEEWSLFFRRYPEHLTFYKGMGCKNCGYTGYKDRTLISELFEINREIAMALSRGVSETQLKRLALAGGMKTMIDDGLLKLDQITLSEIIRVVPIEMIKEFISRDPESGQAEPARASILPASYSERVQFQIADPQKEAAIIDHLFERYQAMRKIVGQTPAPRDGDLFRRFITQSYEQVANKYRCKQVEFEFHARDKGISITATPAGETS